MIFFRRFSYLLTFFVLVFFSCTQELPKNETLISGTISGAAGQKLLLEELTINELIVVDSTFVSEKDSFSFHFQPEESSFFMIRFEDGNTVKFTLHPGDTLSISAHLSELPDKYVIEGNDDAEILQRYFGQTAIFQHRFDSLREVFYNSIHLDTFQLVKQKIDSSLQQLLNNHKEFTVQSIQQSYGSLAGLLLLNQRFAGQPVILPENHPDLYIRLDSVLSGKYPGNSHVLDHHRRVEELVTKMEIQKVNAGRLSPGQTIPDISLPDPLGNKQKLSACEGNPVILYFWVSWSPPCRAVNHQLKMLYEKYHSFGLEIFAISFDHEHRYWSDAIKVDELPWINVSDLRGINSPVKELYNLSGELPWFFFIDPEGKIVASSAKFSEISALLTSHFEK
ncbi:MAG TPA: TlpA disulfide reductase family protein [Bacteroidales bacterium]|nr:TlpA disulfide reductase family protein [Bacteroidales bacterium]